MRVIPASRSSKLRSIALGHRPGHASPEPKIPHKKDRFYQAYLKQRRAAMGKRGLRPARKTKETK